MADSGSAPDGSASFVDDYETLISTTDVELLKIAWRNEKAAPEILPYEAALIHRIKEQIELAEQNVEISESNGEDPLTISLYQMDLDRTQFLLRSYLRVRIQKLNQWMYHIDIGIAQESKGIITCCYWELGLILSNCGCRLRSTSSTL
ncbi:DNA replication complex GINS protein SLD5 [Linum perenne]